MDSICCNIAGSLDPEAVSAYQRHKQVEKYLASEKKRASKIIKTLFLGTGESGKSTIMKQMRIIYSNGISEDERRQMRTVIFANLITAFKDLLDVMATENIAFDTESAKSSANIITKTEPDGLLHLDAAICAAMKNIWQDSGVQKVISGSFKFPYPLHENMLYFYQSIDRLAGPGWLPNDQDILHARVKSTGFSELFFDIGPMTWIMLELGGSRTERRKWIHCFAEVDCLTFVATLSGYDQYLMEDHSANHMHEALMLFDSVINGPLFSSKPVILFLNKIDIFQKKLAVSPFSQHFPDFDGSNTDLWAAAGYFGHRFRRLDRTQGRKIYAHYTKATDTTSMKSTIESVQDSIVQKNLRGLGLF